MLLISKTDFFINHGIFSQEIDEMFLSMTYDTINSICDRKLIVSYFYEKCTTVPHPPWHFPFLLSLLDTFPYFLSLLDTNLLHYWCWIISKSKFWSQIFDFENWSRSFKVANCNFEIRKFSKFFSKYSIINYFEVIFIEQQCPIIYFLFATFWWYNYSQTRL